MPMAITEKSCHISNESQRVILPEVTSATLFYRFYHSYLPTEKDALSYNGELANSDPAEGDATEDSKSNFAWHNTYALEYAEFLLDSSLTRGVHLQTLCANDAFYQRKTTRDGKSDKGTFPQPNCMYSIKYLDISIHYSSLVL